MIPSDARVVTMNTAEQAYRGCVKGLLGVSADEAVDLLVDLIDERIDVERAIEASQPTAVEYTDEHHEAASIGVTIENLAIVREQKEKMESLLEWAKMIIEYNMPGEQPWIAAYNTFKKSL